MGWQDVFDPPECRQARAHLAAGQPHLAAGALLDCRYAEHRAVIQLRREVQQALLAEAQAAHQNQQTEAAREALDWAEKCGTLPVEAVALRAQVEQAAAEQARRHREIDNQRQRLETLLKEGNLHTAAEVAEDLARREAIPSALVQDVQGRLRQLDRYLGECESLVSEGKLDAARAVLRRAQGVCPHDARVLRLLEVLRRRPQANRPTPHAGESPAQAPQPVLPGGTAFVIAELALVVPQEGAVVGSRRELCEVCLLEPVHRRQAELRFRDGQHELLPWHNRDLRHNGKPVERAVALSHGDRIAFRPQGTEWTFQLPVADSHTAVLQAPLGAGSCLANADVRRVILLGDRLEIRPTGPAHLIVPDLPCEALRLLRDPSGIRVEVEGSDFAWEREPSELPPNLLRVPDRLLLWPAQSEMALLAQALAEDSQAVRDSLEFLATG